jgi:NADPH-dependent 7-cyano-7-deazaguanine reductase QueF-like protein
MHDVDVRGTAILQIAQLPPQGLQIWRAYFSSILSGVVRMWISIAAVRILASSCDCH